MKAEGLLAGSSTGTALAAALKYARAQQTAPKRIVVIAPDSGNKYLSKMFSDDWMRDQGFVESRAHAAICRDLIGRRLIRARP